MRAAVKGRYFYAVGDWGRVPALKNKSTAPRGVWDNHPKGLRLTNLRQRVVQSYFMS